MTRRHFTDEEMEQFHALVNQIKSEAYRLPKEGQLVEPAGKERHTSSEHATLSSHDQGAASRRPPSSARPAARGGGGVMAESMGCDCLVKFNEALEGTNTEIRESIVFKMASGESYGAATVVVDKRDPKSREKAKPIIPTFCPFCGKRYEPA